jgi:4-amino-4-deoxy-L-arabinose transferase-like glycosyltransferase
MIQTEPDALRSRQIWVHLAMAALLAATALTIRLRALDVFITPDELKWVCRSINFYRGLQSGHLDQTLQKGHPGVVTMWLGTPWMGIDPAQPWLEICRNPSVSDMIAQVSAQTPAELGGFLFAARRGVAVLTSLAIGAAFLLLARLFNRDVALIASALILFDPFYLAHSRFLHLDAITTSFLFLSVLSLLVALREEHRGFLIASGALSGLAMLNKSPAMITMPFAASVITIYGVAQRRSLGWLIRRGCTWVVPAALVYVLCWPAMWVQPGQTLFTVFDTALFYAGNPHTNSNFFWGAPRADPGPLFYPVALAFRLTPWTMLGGLLGLPWLVRRHRHRSTLWALGSFVVVYAVFMTLGQKKFDRYLLPAFPCVQTIAAVGLLGAGEWVLSTWRVPPPRMFLALALSVLILILGATMVLPHAPYYLTYYNPWLGGPRAAVRTLLVGWGEGLDLGAAYLNTLSDIESRQATARALPGFAPLFDGRAADENSYDAAMTDYVVSYLNEVQRRLSPDLLARYYDIGDPLYTGQIKGIDYVWVYENRTHEPPMAYIDSHADPASDAIVVSRPSLFADRYPGPLPVHVLQPSWQEEDALAMLQSVASDAERVWYVRYAQKNPDPRLEWVDFQWQTHAFLLEQHAYTDVDVFLWETKDASPFIRTDQVRRDLNVRFGDILELQAYTLTEPSAQWGRALGALCEWRSLHDPDEYYASFVHVVDDAGRLWGQGDRWIVNEALVPTVGWKQGDVVSDRTTVSLNPGIPPGTYRLIIGVYDRITQRRLSVTDSAGQAQGDSYHIGTLTVSPSPWKPDPGELPIQHPRRIELTPALRLLGWGLDRAEAGFGDQISAALFWQATAEPMDDYEARLRLVDPSGAVWAEGQYPLASDEYPTSRWEAGEALWRFCDLEVSQDAPTTDVTLTMDVLGTTGQGIAGPIDLGTLHIEGHYFEEPPIAHPQPAQIGDQVRLLGFDVQPTPVEPGDALALTLYWQADAPVARSYTVFTHLLDSTSFVRGQKDAVPHEGQYPTDRWLPGETVVDRYVIQVPEDTPAGDYRLEIGMYDPAEGAQRLPVFDSDGLRQQDDRLLLDIVVQVVP